MVDERVVSQKLEQIEQYHSELTSKQQSLSREDLLRNTTEQRAVERMFENAIQACADLSKHIAAQEFDFSGESSKDAILILGRAEVINEETTNTLIAAVGFRNVLAHQYGEVNHDEVYETLQSGLDVYDSFSQQVAQWYQNRD